MRQLIRRNLCCTKGCYLSLVLVLAAVGPTLLPAAPSGIRFSQSAQEIETYDFVEVTLKTDEPDAKNPFMDVSVHGQFNHSDGKAMRVDGFCDSLDGSVFRIRFMPTRPGNYHYAVRYRQGSYEATHSGNFSARDGNSRGLLRVDSKRPWHFIWAGTGEHYFWNGTTTYYLMGWQRDRDIQQIIDRLHRLKVNRLRVLLYGRNHDRPWGQPVRSTEQFKLYLNPWVAKHPDKVKDPGFDLTRFNVEHWRKYERLLRYAREKDVIVSVIFFIGGQVLPTPFAAKSEDEIRFYRYGVARFAAFSNVTWDLGNEHNFHRKYPDWANWLGPLVKKWDPYDHLTSAHNRVYRTSGKTWNDMQLIQRWDAGQNRFMLDQREAQAATGRIIPQVNEEYGYQDLWEKYPGHRAAETRRRLAWEIYMAGCYQTTGETANRGTGLGADSGGGWVNGRGDDTMTMLQKYANIVEFFTSFDWYETEPHNELVSGGAMCLAQPENLYAVYLPNPQAVTVKLGNANYQARWFDPRKGAWHDLPAANGPVWTCAAPPGDGDWALLLKKDPALTDTTPPRVVSVSAGGRANKVFVVFSELVDKSSATRTANYSIDRGVKVLEATLGGEDNKTVILTTSPLTELTDYTLTVKAVKDKASQPNTIAAASTDFGFVSSSRAIVQLRFDEKTGRSTANTGTSADAHPAATLTKSRPTWTNDVPPHGGAASPDFGAKAGEYAVDLNGGPVRALKGLKSFTITGWVNCRNATAGSGGNRIVTTINNGGEGFDLVFLRDGRLQIGINQWPDGVPAKSSANKITVDANAGKKNWRFFAVTYDSTKSREHVKFYFGSPTQEAALDRAVNYDRGPVGHNTGPLTVGHFNPLTRSGNGDRMFRGLIDEIRIFGSTVDGSGALPLQEIVAIQKGSSAK